MYSTLAPAFAPALAYSQARGGLALLVSQAGQTLYHATASGIALQQALPIASGTKSVAAILAILAIQDGLLTGWDAPVANSLPAWQTHPQKSQISLRHLLSLTSGLPAGRSTLFGGTIPTYAQASQAEPRATLGQRFQYGPIPFQVLGAMVQQQLAQHGYSPDLLGYLQNRLWAPLQIQVGDWTRDVEGNPHLASGLSLTATDWAKLGQLLAARGQWQGKSLLSPQLLQACWQGSVANPAYGLGFWLNANGLDVAGRPWPALAQQPPNLVMCLGAGQQHLYIFPDQQLVIAHQGALRLPLAEFDHGEFLRLISEGLAGL